MANILGDEKQQQVLALGRLGWPLRRIESATSVRRETASAYLKAAGIPVRLPRRRRPPAPNPASRVSTDFGGRWPGPLELTRFRGHRTSWGEEGVHNAEDPTAILAPAPGAAR
jgi:hypothetical protein